MKRVIKFLILGVIAVVFIGTIVFLYRKSHEAPAVFQVDSPVKMSIIKKTVATGKVIPRREVEVKRRSRAWLRSCM
jgi:HlyD family secretion protein